jgi:uncharacterized membrane protein YtjA (UPF0391 family)
MSRGFTRNPDQLKPLSQGSTGAGPLPAGEEAGMTLLWWAVIAFVIALVAGALGFTGVARGAANVGKVLFGIFLVIAILLIILVVLGVGAAAVP